MSDEPTIPQEPDVVANRRVVVVALLTVAIYLVATAVNALLLDERRAALAGEIDARSLVSPVPIDTPMLLDPAPVPKRTLEHYHWVDRDNGVVAIPLDVATQVLVERAATGGAP